MLELFCRNVRRRTSWSVRRRWLPDRYVRLRVHMGLSWVEVDYAPKRGYVPFRMLVWGDQTPIIFAPLLEGMKVKRREAKQSQVTKDGPSHLAPIESDVFSKLHNIVAHCCVTRYDDGEGRVPGWVTIKSQGSAWVVQCKDPDSCTSLQAIGQSLDDALALADLLLGAEEAPWEPDRFLQSMRRERKK